MTEAESVKQEFEDFKKEVETKFSSYPIVDKSNFKTVFKEIFSETSRDQEKITLMRSIQVIAVVGFVIVSMLLAFIIFLLCFTEPM